MAQPQPKRKTKLERLQDRLRQNSHDVGRMLNLLEQYACLHPEWLDELLSVLPPDIAKVIGPRMRVSTGTLAQKRARKTNRRSNGRSLGGSLSAVDGRPIDANARRGLTGGKPQS